jgi:uncharacterized coiled-coil protein SlyX
MVSCDRAIERLIFALNRTVAERAKDLDRLEALEKRVADMQAVLDRAADDGR